ncbi:WD40 repeat domain-containing protein (plasmid) [Deinococcus sp. KNUC1210]|uniref:WD40 domain-containing protein n=1 Tax=Deinococcus sp. KNUC1210 TaxID=2917691 RepID=UPI001EEF7C29|nr:WD40 repeat domain-containing protein [Deinococcus sp. KNUC1210]ULH18250.1 WD40 repeat domain-containing protein [Deinococcus sp. KNUC1210]
MLDVTRSPSEHALAYSNEAGQVWMHDLQTNAAIGSGQLAPARRSDLDAEHQPLWIREIQWNPAGTDLAIAGSWGELYDWQPHKSPIRLLATHSVEKGFTALEWSTDGTRVIAGQRDGGVTIVDLKSHTVVQSWSTGQGTVLSLTVQGDTITTLGQDKTLSQWRIEQQRTP